MWPLGPPFTLNMVQKIPKGSMLCSSIYMGQKEATLSLLRGLYAYTMRVHGALGIRRGQLNSRASPLSARNGGAGCLRSILDLPSTQGFVFHLKMENVFASSLNTLLVEVRVRIFRGLGLLLQVHDLMKGSWLFESQGGPCISNYTKKTVGTG